MDRPADTKIFDHASRDAYINNCARWDEEKKINIVLTNSNQLLKRRDHHYPYRLLVIKHEQQWLAQSAKQALMYSESIGVEEFGLWSNSWHDAVTNWPGLSTKSFRSPIFWRYSGVSADNDKTSPTASWNPVHIHSRTVTRHVFRGSYGGWPLPQKSLHKNFWVYLFAEWPSQLILIIKYMLF